jgi:ribonuclease E
VPPELELASNPAQQLAQVASIPAPDSSLQEPATFDDAPTGNPVYRRYEDAAPMPRPLPRWDEVSPQPEVMQPPSQALEAATTANVAANTAPAAGVEPASPAWSALQTVPDGIFMLPVEQLQSQLSSAGLEWVNSDAEKIRAAQELMAQEVHPVHTPRERKPAEVAEAGPLIMVETRKDLRQVKLPFESSVEA